MLWYIHGWLVSRALSSVDNSRKNLSTNDDGLKCLCWCYANDFSLSGVSLKPDFHCLFISQSNMWLRLQHYMRYPLLCKWDHLERTHPHCVYRAPRVSSFHLHNSIASQDPTDSHGWHRSLRRRREKGNKRRWRLIKLTPETTSFPMLKKQLGRHWINFLISHCTWRTKINISSWEMTSSWWSFLWNNCKLWTVSCWWFFFSWNFFN